MRHLATVIACVVLAPFMLACASPCGAPPTLHLGLPTMDVPPPLMFMPTATPPQFQATSYAQVMQVPVAPQYAAVPMYAAPAAAAPCAPPSGYTGGFSYAQPPQAPAPRAAGDCR